MKSAISLINIYIVSIRAYFTRTLAYSAETSSWECVNYIRIGRDTFWTLSLILQYRWCIILCTAKSISTPYYAPRPLYTNTHVVILILYRYCALSCWCLLVAYNRCCVNNNCRSSDQVFGDRVTVLYISVYAYSNIFT